MIFAMDRSPLLDALHKMQTVVEKKNTIQILGNILCSVQGKLLSLYATDLEVVMQITLEVEAQKDGKITLSAKHFFDIVKELPDKKLYITQKENHWVELLCGKTRFNIVSLPAERYPTLPRFEDKIYHEAQIKVLTNMIDRTQFAASSDTTRYQINSVFLECLENGLMRMSATDSHRLSFVDQEVFLNQSELKRGIIIPKKGLSELRKFLDDKIEFVGISFERGYLFLKLNQSYLCIRLIDGEYPDYHSLVPKHTTRLITLNRQDFCSALKRVSLLSNEKVRGVRLNFQKKTLLISSINTDTGEAQEELDIDYEGEPFEMGFNSKYLLDGLTVMNSEMIELHLKDRLSPGICYETKHKSHTYVVMPMRI